MNEPDITSRPDGEGIVRVRIAGQVDMATAALITDAANKVIAGGASRDPHGHGRGDVPGRHRYPDPAVRATRRGLATQAARRRRPPPVVRVLDITGVLETLRDGPAQQETKQDGAPEESAHLYAELAGRLETASYLGHGDVLRDRQVSALRAAGR